MRHLLLSLLFSLLAAASAFGEVVGEGGAGVVRALNGDGLAVQVPAGWVLDNRALAQQGIDMYFYPADSGAIKVGSKAPVFAYVMPTYKGAPYVTVQGLIDLRKKQLMQLDKASSIDIEQAAAPSANKVSTVTIMRYATPSLPRYERVAYLEDSRTIFAVVLSAASPELLQQNSRFIDDLIATHQRTIAAAKP